MNINRRTGERVRARVRFFTRGSPSELPNAKSSDRVDRVDRVDRKDDEDSIFDSAFNRGAPLFGMSEARLGERKHRAIQIIGASLWIARSGNADLTDPASRGKRWISI